MVFGAVHLDRGMLQDPVGQGNRIAPRMFKADMEDHIDGIDGVTIVTNKVTMDTGSVGMKRVPAKIAGEQFLQFSVPDRVAANETTGSVRHGKGFFAKIGKYVG